jgi:hypothetical protein
MSVNFFEIDQNVTNVTIKDAPCEESDQFIATHMSNSISTLYDFMKIITIFLPSCFFFMSRAVTLYIATLTTMLAQDIIFTVLGYVSLFIQ